MKTIEFETGMVYTRQNFPENLDVKKIFPFNIDEDINMSYIIREATEEETEREKKRLARNDDEYHNFKVNEHQRLTGDLFLQNFKQDK